MKYTYAYKTSDGTRHEDSMNASSREEVFAELRKHGIKAIKVVAADGSKANGEVRGVRRRVVLAIVCFAAIVTGGIVYIATSSKAGSIATKAHIDAPNSRMRNATPLPRQMIPGDRGRIAEAAASLKSAPERLLAAFVEPGRSLTALDGKTPTEAEFAAILREPLKIADDEFTESVDLKRIVTRIKADLRRFLAAGGTADEFIAELIKRQKLEIAYREKAEARLNEMLKGDTAKAYDFFLKANAQLQSMGIYPLPLPDTLRSYQNTLDFDE